MQERETISELAMKYNLHPNQISRWKKEFLDRAPEVFEKPSKDKKDETDLEKLYAKIGHLEMEREYLKKLKETGTVSDRLSMVDRNDNLSIRNQCNLVNVNRGSFYCQTCGEKADNLKIMRLMDEHYLKHPTAGVIVFARLT